MLADLTVKDFLDKVACSDPVPGGGSIAALDGALASALSTMVARLTVGKKGYEASEEVMQHAQTITLRLLDEFIALIDKDSAAYNEVFACFKLPKTTDEEKAARSAAIQEATKQAALVPLEVARIICVYYSLFHTSDSFIAYPDGYLRLSRFLIRIDKYLCFSFFIR